MQLAFGHLGRLSRIDLRVVPDLFQYVTFKAGVEDFDGLPVINLTQGLATDLAHLGIRANAVCPGPVETPMVAAIHDAATREHWVKHVPMRRYGSVDEIASLVAFLLDGSQSSYVTGQAIAADGGFAGAGLTRIDT